MPRNSASFFSFVILLDGVLDVGVRQHVGPERSYLMRVVDLHNVELLYDLGVYVYLLHLEDWYDLLAKIDGDQVVQRSQGLDLLINL